MPRFCVQQPFHASLRSIVQKLQSSIRVRIYTFSHFLLHFFAGLLEDVVQVCIAPAQSNFQLADKASTILHRDRITEESSLESVHPNATAEI